MNPATNFNDTVHLVALTDNDLSLIKGLIASYQHTMLLDLRKGALTEQGIRRYRADLAEAGELMVKLGGVA
jgi:hypothetical protein